MGKDKRAKELQKAIWDELDKARAVLMASMSVTGPLYTHEQFDEGMEALSRVASLVNNLKELVAPDDSRTIRSMARRTYRRIRYRA